MDNLFVLPNMYSAIRIPGMEYSRNRAGWSYPNHRHPFFEFLCCVKGEIRQWVNGQQYHLYPGDAILIGSDMYHRTEAVTDCMFFDFHFDVELPDVHSIFQSSTYQLFRHAENEALISRIQLFLKEFGVDLHRMGQENAREKDAVQRPEAFRLQMEKSIRTLSIHASLLEIVGMLANRLLQESDGEFSDTEVTPSQIRLAREAACYIEENLLEDIRVHHVAKQLNVHRTHLHTCFKNVYGISPSVYIINARIREAKNLLMTMNWSMEEIGQHLRFSSSAHFSRAFRAIVGMPPVRFRQHARAK
ncbi:AraC family transcriptional regulator [Paenibacillus lignilyticus]|uniref:Helix-turn-helix transcriptional regulator n=1 Tax=Paenibacillus lignilyticus TaxID=1172615 RepID=A0ABS5CIY0_9BACL|nr:AraC family transcriptional regulator [Paenibacillus lignilyticus]MBP3965823.1 helix-turn-helix transcriptional regulator [Paenibacillus lignilyticus]